MSQGPAADATQSLEGLLQRVGDGDRVAFGRLYDQAAGLVFGIVKKVVRDPAQSEEVAQEVMVEIWRTAPRYDPGRGSARSWMATIAHRRAVDLVRSAQSSRDRSETYGRREAASAPFDSVVEEVVAATERNEVRSALGRLTDVEREAIELAYYGAMTYREVAEKLETPLGTVKTRMRSGLTRLRSVLAASDPGEGAR